MTPVHCIVAHEPPDTYGDCLRACVASLLDKPCADVPHFAHDGCDGQTMRDRLAAWLKPQGYAPFFIGYDAALPMDHILQMTGRANPDTHYLLFGGNHVVICKDDHIEYDPGWIPSTLLAPKDGLWIIMVVAVK